MTVRPFAQATLPFAGQAITSFAMRSLFPRAQRHGAAQAALAPGPKLPRPAATTYVVGDLHGRADLLEPMFERIDRHIGTVAEDSPFLVFVGDYVGYGPASHETLLRLKALTEEFPRNVVCLMGSHERMFLDFLTDPEMRGARWMRFGGAATLESFGVPEPARHPDAYQQAADALHAAMEPGLLDWIAARPLSWHSGNLWVVHAAADPKHSMPAQSARVLLWGHPEFEVVPRSDGVWVCHGHTEVDTPQLVDGRANVDTGAWKTGRLAAAAIVPTGEVEFLTTEA